MATTDIIAANEVEFAEVLRLEDLVRTERALAAMGSDGATRYRNELAVKRDQPKALAALTALFERGGADLMAAYGVYRANHGG